MPTTRPWWTPCRVSLNRRGDNATGWGLGWRLNLWARLHDGARAYRIVRNLLNDAQAGRGGSGVYNNLFDAHPPFQIDGNFGGAAGIAESLLQSTAPRAGQPAQIELLPALPPQWPTGKVTGLGARGGFEVDIQWKEGKLVSATVRSRPAPTGGTPPGTPAGPCRLHYGAATRDVNLAKGQSAQWDGIQ